MRKPIIEPPGQRILKEHNMSEVVQGILDGYMKIAVPTHFVIYVKNYGEEESLYEQVRMYYVKENTIIIEFWSGESTVLTDVHSVHCQKKSE